MAEEPTPAIADVDDLLTSQGYLWSVVRDSGREKKLAARLLEEINDLLEFRFHLMKVQEEQKQ